MSCIQNFVLKNKDRFKSINEENITLGLLGVKKGIRELKKKNT